MSSVSNASIVNIQLSMSGHSTCYTPAVLTHIYFLRLLYSSSPARQVYFPRSFGARPSNKWVIFQEPGTLKGQSRNNQSSAKMPYHHIREMRKTENILHVVVHGGGLTFRSACVSFSTHGFKCAVKIWHSHKFSENISISFSIVPVEMTE